MSTKWKKEYNWHMEDTAQQGGNESQQLFTWFFTLKKIIEDLYFSPMNLIFRKILFTTPTY